VRQFCSRQHDACAVGTHALSQLALAFGSLSLWTFGLRVGLIPRAFAGYAVLAYIIHMGGTVADGSAFVSFRQYDRQARN